MPKKNRRESAKNCYRILKPVPNLET